jgi:hypothetical protein
LGRREGESVYVLMTMRGEERRGEGFRRKEKSTADEGWDERSWERRRRRRRGEKKRV